MKQCERSQTSLTPVHAQLHALLPTLVVYIFLALELSDKPVQIGLLTTRSSCFSLFHLFYRIVELAL